ncbi:MAG: hypothetical protein BWY09_02980 [Candidatus Hydrogenedentes bacterium ADurb.Bin179]|jgi:hypothetical protein|nr:MAG: hypothetical protein BWY09_02980 [Candidatus Hydrogenedentes bacterium ADurb.Bin179]
MHQRPRFKYFVVLILTLAIAGQAHLRTASATPAPPVLLVNHALQQCIEQVYLSDECFYCRVVNGWEISSTGQCPVGYQTVNHQYPFAEKNRPLDCVEGPREEWMACAWGQYPTVTPYFTVTPTAPDVREPSDPPIFMFLLCTGALVSILILSVVILRKKKPF